MRLIRAIHDNRGYIYTAAIYAAVVAVAYAIFAIL